MNRFLLTMGLTLVLTVPATAEMKSGQSVTLKGEVLDLACYADHGASGPQHMGCAQTCISSGLPVGLKAEDGKTYLVVGEHKPLNAALAPLAGKTVTLKGKFVERDGVRMLANAKIMK